MSRTKRPETLYRLCRKNVNAMIIFACKAIQDQCHSYNTIECESMISKIQHFLLSNIPGLLLDDLSRYISNNYRCRFSVHERALNVIEDDLDMRILLSVYLHKNMRIFSVCIKLPQDVSFWTKHLLNMHRLVVLDLSLICTDEILETIGNNCGLLEKLTIIPEYKCYSPYNSVDQKTGIIPSVNFVSDIGLKHLCKCKNLKVIEVGEQLKNQFVGVSNDGVREVLKSLPKLQYINYSNAGEVIETLVGEVNELKLINIIDSNSCSSHIRSFDKLCPNLRKLFLHQPRNETKRTNAHDIMKSLRDSRLKLSALKLKYFPIDGHFEDFIKIKGTFLISLNVSCTNPISSDELVVIGTLCPNLEDIYLTNVTSSTSDLKNFQLAVNETKMFSPLKTLVLTGRCWPPHIILPILLNCSLNLNHIILSNEEYIDIIDDTFSRVMSVNPFKKLSRVFLYAGCFITYKTVAKFVSTCSYLTHFSIVKHPTLEVEKCMRLKDKVVKKIQIELISCGF